MARTTRQELIEENERLIDALEETRDRLDDVLGEYEKDGEEESDE